MTARDGSPGMNDAAKAHAFSRRSFLFGLSVLAVVAFFDARPAAAQYVGVGPFGIYLGGAGGRSPAHRFPEPRPIPRAPTNKPPISCHSERLRGSSVFCG